MVKDIDLKKVPEIIRLAEADEELNHLLALSPDTLLIRWVNWHLKNQNSSRRITNLGKDVQDGEVYTLVLNSIDPNCISKSNLDNDPKERARNIVQAAQKLGFTPFISPSDITSGNTKLNTVFTAEIFNHRHGLPPLDAAEEEEFNHAVLLDDDAEGSNEERSYRMWMNSLNLDGVQVNNLYEEAKDGLLLLKVIDRVQPGVVNWAKVEKAPGNNQIKRQVNCQAVIESAKNLNCKIPGIDSSQIIKGQRKAILAIVWQIVRTEYLKIIGGQSEKDLLNWANSKVADSSLHVSSFKDPKISSGLWLIHLCEGIQKNCVNWEIVTEGATDEDKALNAKYAISIARMLGAVVFCIWEDIIACKEKMILVFICSLHEVAKNKAAGLKSPLEEAKTYSGEEIKEDTSIKKHQSAPVHVKAPP